MRRLLWICCCGCMLVGLVGCGDTPQLVLRDTLTFLNEMLDHISKIPDDEGAEDAAAAFTKSPAYLLKERAESLRHRWDIYKATDKDAMREIKEAGEFWRDEFQDLLTRIKYAIGRLDKIEDRLAEEECQKFRGPKREAMVGIEKEKQNDIAAYAERGVTLKIVEKARVCPNLFEMQKKIDDIFSKLGGKGPAPEKKEKKAEQK